MCSTGHPGGDIKTGCQRLLDGWAHGFLSIANEAILDQATKDLYATLRKAIDIRLDSVNRLNQVALVLILAIALGISYWLYLQVLRPLDAALKGFRKVASGDFGHEVRVGAHNELRWLGEGFNLLSWRLSALFQLIDRLQSGSNLDQTLQFVAEELDSLLPLDWVGVLFVTANVTTIKLDRSYSEGTVEIGVRARFPLAGTYLDRALRENRPTHVPEIPATSARHAELGAEHARLATIGEMAILEIHNEGDPISPEALSKLTTPLFTTKTMRTGLGLSIVKRLTEAHGGELSILSGAEEGTLARVKLPASSA